jgi:toxin ParE1/3/4
MREIVKRPRAREDLKAVWRYSLTEWGESQADKYLAEVEAGIARLKEHPELGRAREDLRPSRKMRQGANEA